jgi:hypothetical protein
MKTEPTKAREFCELLYAGLVKALCDTDAVRGRVADIAWHACRFPETRFCKGCVLPVVDRAATAFLSGRFGLRAEEIRNALRCEGAKSLPEIYEPGPGQSGFGLVHAYGENYQRTAKNGRVSDKPRGERPSPDFGIVHRARSKFSMLGETKYSERDTKIEPLLREVVRDLRYYLALPPEPEKNWDYDFGFGVAYAACGAGPRAAFLMTEYWDDGRFVVACFHA